MPKLSEYWDNFENYTGKASDVSRKLSFAGIAIIWLFHIGNAKEVSVPEELLPVLAFFVLSLSFDLLQYIVASIVWGLFCRHNEKKLKEIEDDPELAAPRWINLPTNFFFIGKLIFIIVGYFLLLKFFWRLLLTS